MEQSELQFQNRYKGSVDLFVAGLFTAPGKSEQEVRRKLLGMLKGAEKIGHEAGKAEARKDIQKLESDIDFEIKCSAEIEHAFDGSLKAPGMSHLEVKTKFLQMLNEAKALGVAQEKARGKDRDDLAMGFDATGIAQDIVNSSILTSDPLLVLNPSTFVGGLANNIANAIRKGFEAGKSLDQGRAQIENANVFTNGCRAGYLEGYSDAMAGKPRRIIGKDEKLDGKWGVRFVAKAINQVVKKREEQREKERQKTGFYPMMLDENFDCLPLPGMGDQVKSGYIQWKTRLDPTPRAHHTTWPTPKPKPETKEECDQVAKLKKLVRELLDEVEAEYECLDQDRGKCRTAKELYAACVMPLIAYEAKKFLEDMEG